jgi:ABC-type uncharacterized transport system permease subunit
VNWKTCFVVCGFDNSQVSLSDFSNQVLMALRALGYAVTGVTTTTLVQAAWLNGTFQNGSNQVAVMLGVPATMTDAAVGVAVSNVIANLFMPLSTTPTVITNVTVYDTVAAPTPGPPNPSAEPSPGNP